MLFRTRPPPNPVATVGARSRAMLFASVGSNLVRTLLPLLFTANAAALTQRQSEGQSRSRIVRTSPNPRKQQPKNQPPRPTSPRRAQTLTQKAGAFPHGAAPSNAPGNAEPQFGKRHNTAPAPHSLFNHHPAPYRIVTPAANHCEIHRATPTYHRWRRPPDGAIASAAHLLNSHHHAKPMFSPRPTPPA